MVKLGQRKLSSPINDSTERLVQELHNTCDESSNANNPILPKSQAKTKILILLSLTYFLSYGALALMAPFFTLVAKTKGVSQTVSGLIFSIFALVMFVFSPFIGKLLPRFGPKFTLLIGCFIEAYTEVLFGYTSLIDDSTIFIVFCFVVRSVTAFGTACVQTAELAIVAVVFKENKAVIYGILEIFTGAGLMTSPVVGGILYKVGHFKLPFIVYGSLTFLLLVLLYFILPNKTELSPIGDERNEKPGSITKILSIPGIYLVSFVVVLCAAMITFIEPLLTNQLEKITDNGLTSDKVGYFFLIMPGTYTLMSPLIGFITDKLIKSRYLIIIGQLLAVATLLFLGPTHFFKSFIPQTLLTLGLSLGILGISISCALIPCIADMHLTAIKAGYKDSIATSGLLSGIYNSCFSIGALIGPTLGSFLTEKLSFESTATIFSGLILTSCILLVIETIKSYCFQSRQKRLELSI